MGLCRNNEGRFLSFSSFWDWTCPSGQRDLCSWKPCVFLFLLCIHLCHFMVSLFSLFFFFYVFMYNCLNIKKGRWAIRVQTPLPLLDYLFSKQVYCPLSDFLFVYIIAMFFLLKWPDPFVSSRAHTLPPTTGDAQRAPLNGWISVRVISLGLIYLITLL